MLELQRPARKRPGLEDGKILNDDTIGSGNRNRGGGDERCIDPQRGILVLVIEFGPGRGVMVRFEMAVDDFRVAVF